MCVHPCLGNDAAPALLWVLVVAAPLAGLLNAVFAGEWSSMVGLGEYDYRSISHDDVEEFARLLRNPCEPRAVPPSLRFPATVAHARAHNRWHACPAAIHVTLGTCYALCPANCFKPCAMSSCEGFIWHGQPVHAVVRQLPITYFEVCKHLFCRAVLLTRSAGTTRIAAIQSITTA